MSIPAPIVSSVASVDPAWIDYNGHMNMAYYSLLFDHAVDEAYAVLGFGPEYIASRQHTTYTAEFHVCYVRELHLGDRVRCRFQLLDHDEKRIHSYQEMWHEDGWLAATAESLSLHIDMSGPRVAPFPADVMSRLQAIQQAHAALPRPERAGRGIGIVRRG
jgi:acyl-CoA thioester hydrolase